MQDEGIGGQAEPEMGGAAALPPPQPPPPRTYADKIASSEALCPDAKRLTVNLLPSLGCGFGVRPQCSCTAMGAHTMMNGILWPSYSPKHTLTSIILSTC